MKGKKPTTTRRDFVKTSGALLAGTALGANIILPKNSYAGDLNSETLKVGLIGCGGRGSGAANQALSADSNVVLHAMADAFADRLESSHKHLMEAHPDKVKVDKERMFVGFDAYQQLIDSGVDVVLLATPPAFRPDHLTAAVNAKKHIFCEKPMAVDAPGIQKVLKAANQAKAQGTSLMSGFCWRYHYPKRETFDRVLNGKIGKVVAVYNTYNAGYLWQKPRQPEWSEMEYKLRNWIYYNWLSGDHIAEQAIHSLDMMSWAMGNELPVSAIGTGGRQRRTEDIYGNVYDHFTIAYEYANGARGFHYSRQMKDTERTYHVEILGTKGSCLIDCIRRKHEIRDLKGKLKWQYEGKANDMYQTEHDELFAAIRSGNPVYDGQWMSESTMLALWGRMVAYTGQKLSYEEAFNSQEVLGPKGDQYSWDLDWPTPPVAKPGMTEFR